jgi:hypothetical protein
MPTWNSARHLAETVESVLQQTFGDFDLIVVDGGSTDGTLDILARYKDRRIRVFVRPDLKATPARNYALAQSEAQWIAVLDSDDISLPKRFENQLRALEAVPDAVLSYTDFDHLGDLSAAAGDFRFARTRAFLAVRLSYFFPMVHSTVMFKREAAKIAGEYTWACAEDYGLVSRLVRIGNVAPVFEKLVQFRLHSTSLTHRTMKELPAVTAEIATENCQAFFRLSPADARRAYSALKNHGQPGQWSEWLWFMRTCIPRLPWKSFELYSWLAFQTLKTLRPGGGGGNASG